MLAHATTRRTMLATTAAAAVSAAAPALAVASRPELADDARLFALINRLDELDREIAALNAQADVLRDQLPSTAWTAEELKAHGVQGAVDGVVSLDLIKKNNRWDHPSEGPCTHTHIREGNKLIQTVVTETRDYTEQEEAAWRARCDARRALFDAKQTAYDQASAALGLPTLLDRIAAAETAWSDTLDEIAECRPATLRGVVAMLAVYRKHSEIDPSDPEEEAGTVETLFLRALSAAERMAAGAA